MTPKGIAVDGDIPLIILLPFIVLSIAAALPVVLLDNVGNATPFYIFSSLNALLYAVITGTVIYKHKQERKRSVSATELLKIAVAAKHRDESSG